MENTLRLISIAGLLCALVLAGCASPLPVTPPAGMPASVQAVEPRVGEAWAYAVRDGYTGLPHGTWRYRVEEKYPDFYTVRVTHVAPDGHILAERHEHYTLQGNWIESAMTNLPVFHYDPPYAAFVFPLTAGESWRAYVGAVDSASGRRNRVRIDATVNGWEHIAVPAGQYDTLRVRRAVYAGNHDYFRGEENITEIEWYAPRLGRAVKRETNSGYIDRSRGCTMLSGCGWVRNDWLIWEMIWHDGGGSNAGSAPEKPSGTPAATRRTLQ